MDILAFVKRKGNFSTLLLGMGSVLAGTAAAVIRGNMEILSASVCLLFAIFTQLGATYLHCYNELTKYYAKLPRPRITNEKYDENPLATRVLREAFTACLILSLMLGLTLMTMARETWLALLIGVLIYGLNALLNYGKYPLYGTKWSILITFLIFGPIGVMGTCLVQSQHEATEVWGAFDTLPPIYLGLAMGFLAMSVHLVYSYYMYRINPESNPTSFTRSVGPRVVEFLVFINGLILLGLMVFKVFYLDYPEPLLSLAPVFLGFSLNTYIALKLRHSNVGELHHLGMLTKVNFFLTGLTLFLVWWAIGSPDDSMRVFYALGQ